MYSPTTGRFITTDPTGFQAGDVDLYRFVGNDPTDHVDPTGLFADSDWRRIAVFAAPRKWSRPSRGVSDPGATIQFYQVRGLPGGLFTGRLTQPPSAETDSGWGKLVWGGQPAAFSMLELSGNDKPGGVCNTPVAPTKPPRPSDKDWLIYGGSLKAILSGFCPGKYEVEVQYKISMSLKTKGNLTSIVSVFSPDDKGDLRTAFMSYEGFARDALGSIERQGTVTVKVAVDDDGRADLLGLRLNMAGRTGVIKTRLELYVDVADMKKV